MRKTCAIVGSGIAGLASAIRLVKLGYEVDVYERRAVSGGKMSELNIGDYRFDAGPTVLTMPWLIDELFELHGLNPRDYFVYKQLDNPVRYFFDDGLVVNAYSDLEKYANEVNKQLGVPKKSFRKYVKNNRLKFKLTHEVFLKSSLQELKNYTRWIAIKGILLFNKVGVFRTMNSFNSSVFKSSRMIDIVNRYAQYNGSNPYKMPSTFNIIAHVEMEKGVYVVDGGMYQIVRSLEKMAKELGVRFHFNSEVDKFHTKENRIIAIEANGEIKKYDLFVSNADIYYSHRYLLKGKSRKGLKKENEKSSSSIIFYWTMKKTFEKLNTHNFFFGKDSKREFATIFNEGAIPSDNTVYLNIGSKHSETDAPAEGETWFAMVNVPNNLGQDWEKEIVNVRKGVIAKISSALREEISPHILEEKVAHPKILEELFFCRKGAIYGDSSNDMFAVFKRHPNFSKEYKNLFFAGGSVHPGAGIPLCFYSAQIACGLIEKRI